MKDGQWATNHKKNDPSKKEKQKKDDILPAGGKIPKFSIVILICSYFGEHQDWHEAGEAAMMNCYLCQSAGSPT